MCALADGFLRVVSSEGRFYQYFVQRGECQLGKNYCKSTIWIWRWLMCLLLVLEMPLYSESQGNSTEAQGYTQLFKYQEEVSEQE